MTSSFHRMLESKRVARTQIALRPAGEKLRILDALRTRELAIRVRVGSADVRSGTRSYVVARYNTNPE